MTSNSAYNAKILIVDDEERNTRVLHHILVRVGYTNVFSINDSRTVVSQFHEIEPDLVLLDLHMPHLDGFAVLNQLNELIPDGTYLPILVLTADVTAEARQRALTEGAKDFLTKPFDATEVLLRIQNMLETRFLNKFLEQRVHERTAELEKSQGEILERLAQAAEFRDDDTGHHTQRVGLMAGIVATKLGLDADFADYMRRAAPLHDVGKIGIPDSILLKPGKLTPDEFDIIKTHTTIGAALLDNGQSHLVRLACTIALTHHERWDGRGYPRGLKEDEIPIEGRILAIVDVFDALIHERPYKKAWPVADALAEIANQSGKQFDPQVVTAFLSLPHDVIVEETECAICPPVLTAGAQ